jgi:hypothetical protein
MRNVSPYLNTEYKVKDFYQCSPIFARAVRFGLFLCFAHFPFMYEKHVVEDEYGVLVE